MKKVRLLAMVCSFVFVVALLCNFQASAATYDNYYVTIFDSTRIRSSATTNSSIVAEVVAKTRLQDYNNAIVANTWRYNPNSWAHVRASTNSGYVRCDLVCPLTRAYQVNVSSELLLRSGAYSSAPVIGGLVNGTVVARDSGFTTNDGITWAHVVVMNGAYEGYSGYVAFSYLSLYAL